MLAEMSHMNLARTGHQYSATSLEGSSSAHFGDVYHQYYSGHAAPDRSCTPLRPSLRIPFRRDRDFVERDILNEIVLRTSEPAARVALVGLGGVGKTQIAIEYAYRRREADPEIWILWVHMSSRVRFEESYRQIAQQVDIDSWSDPKADVLSIVHAWLSDERNGRWTMVVDNADSSEVVFGSHSGQATTSSKSSASAGGESANDRSLADYLPPAAHGSIVITSRSRGVAEGLIEYAEDILDVEPMMEKEAVVLLTKKLNRLQRGVDLNNMTRLVQQLDYMPLAITQAAAYINQLGPRMTVSDYLDRLATSDIDRDRLLAKDIRDPRRDRQASNSIIITWHTSFEHLRQIRSSAARLLGLTSLFDREGIPSSLLKGRYSSEEEEQSRDKVEIDRLEDRFDFEEDIAMLGAYSLISVGANEQLLNMHRLVQFSTRKWLELYGELAHWQGRYISILDTAFPTGDYVNWSICQVLFPHVEHLLSYRVENHVHGQKRAAVLYRGAWFADDSGQYRVAGKMAQASLEDRERLLGANDTRTLESVENLALVLQHQGKYEQAEEMSRRALAGYEKELGPSHPDTLTSVSNLASVLRRRGKYEQAEEMNRRALVGREKELGPSHSDTLTSVSNLALVLRNKGKYEQAEEMNRRALVEREKELGPSHPYTLTSVSNLALVLRDQGKYEQAEEMNRRALVGREKELGPSHPDTLTDVSNLALVLRDQGKYEEAEEMNRRALAGSEKELGLSHPDTLTSVSNLASVLQSQGKYEQAEEMNRRALVGREKELGPSHPYTLTSVSKLASVLQSQGKYEEAEEMNRRALVGKEKELGLSHPDTLTSVSNLASVLRDQGKYEEAEKMNRRALAGSEKELGLSHPDTLTSVYCLAYLLHAQHNHTEALRLYDRAVEGYMDILGPSHPTSLACQRHRRGLLQDMNLPHRRTEK